MITATSTGFGKLTTITPVKESHTVIAAMRETTSKKATIAQELTALPTIDVVEMDITSNESVRQTIE